MTTIVVALLCCLAIAVLTLGLVVVGLQGRGCGRAPKVARTMAKAARHLNGDGQPPRALTRLLH